MRNVIKYSFSSHLDRLIWCLRNVCKIYLDTYWQERLWQELWHVPLFLHAVAFWMALRAPAGDDSEAFGWQLRNPHIINLFECGSSGKKKVHSPLINWTDDDVFFAVDDLPYFHKFRASAVPPLIVVSLSIKSFMRRFSLFVCYSTN